MEITAQELKKRLHDHEHVMVIDVREDWEFDEVNIGVKNIPLGELPRNLDQLPNKDSEIIVHCQSGKRSCQAQKYLISQGYSNVLTLKGGIEAYLEM